MEDCTHTLIKRYNCCNSLALHAPPDRETAQSFTLNSGETATIEIELP